MHDAAFAFVARFASDAPLDVIEFGSLDINGSPRPLFPAARYVGVDLVDGPGVDEVGDAATWTGPPADVVICCEVFEHAEGWPDIVANMRRHLRPGGLAVMTAAGPTRAPHSAVDGGGLRPGEFYRNVDPDELEAAMLSAGFVSVEVDEVPGDVRATGRTA